jgi:hypothetical protein
MGTGSANEPTRAMLANVAALEATAACSTPSYAAMLLHLHRSPLSAELARDTRSSGPSGVLDGLDDHEKANLRVILREAIAAREELEKVAPT